MNVYVPYTKLERATKRAVYGTHPHLVELIDNESYYDYFVDRWNEGKDFINVEHDVAPWPGALQELWACDKPWCAFGYEPDTDYANPAYTPALGCVRFKASFITGLADMWDVLEDRHWQRLDGHLASYARAYGFEVHQHRPAVLNIGQGFKLHNPEEHDRLPD